MSTKAKMKRVEVRLSPEGITFLKSHKRIYTDIGYLVKKDADSVKRWVRDNHKRLVGHDVVEAVKQITGEDLTKYFVKN